jgi:aminopeptidase
MPRKEILERYGELLVQIGLRDGDGIRPGETVLVVGYEDTKPLFLEVCRAIWRAGGNVIPDFRFSDEEGLNMSEAFYDVASDAQLDWFPEKFRRGLVDEMDHMIFIDGERDPKALRDVPADKLMRRQASMLPWVQWRMEKERAGKLEWTIGLYGTEAAAAEAGTTLEDYWQQIIHACFLEDDDPVSRWLETLAKIHEYRNWLSALPIDRLHLEAEGIDLWLTLGEQRKWAGGTGKNIPSFEVFTSPDWRGTNGRIKFSEPLYHYGKLAKGVELEFKDGLVVRATADENADMIREMVAAPGANRVGEFSLTDASVSRINRFMANTLYDENMGGPFGNTHLAVGLSLTVAYDGDESTVSDARWEELGFNLQTAVHTDIVSTTDRTVTAMMKDGSSRVIYSDGHFQM